MNLRVLVGLGIVTNLAWSGAQKCVRAQETPQSEIAANEWQVREIVVKNVPVRMMAWWLDSAHNAEPLVIRQSRLNRGAVGSTPARPPQQIFALLPAGVNSVTVASEERNSILVAGSKTGIETIADAVQKFDKPLCQVEVKLQAFEIGARDLKNLGLNFSAIVGTLNAGRATPISLARVPDREQLQARLQQLTAHKKPLAVVSRLSDLASQNDEGQDQGALKTLKVVAIHGLTAKLSSRQMQPATVGTQKAGRLVSWFQPQSTGAKVHIGVESGLAVTPWIGDDKTVTLSLMPLKTMQISVDAPSDTRDSAKDTFFRSPSFLLRPLEGFRHTVVFQSGETLAFSGLSPSLFDTNSFVPRKDGNLILLVTARILPRFGDEETPGN